MKIDEHISQVIESIITLDEQKLKISIDQALAADIDPLIVIKEGITKGLVKIGVLFADEKIFLPELVQAGTMVTRSMGNLESAFKEGQSQDKKGIILMATVKGDVHDIGKNIVSLIMSASGYEVIDLGKDVSADKVLESVVHYNPHLVGLSSLLSTTMPAQQESIQTLLEGGVRDNVRILVGGAPVTKAWADEIGADGYAENPSQAVVEADKLMKTFS